MTRTRTLAAFAIAAVLGWGPGTFAQEKPKDELDRLLENLEKKENLPPIYSNPAAATEKSDQDPFALLQRIRVSDDAHPIQWPLWKKWAVVFVYCLLQVFVTLTSTTYVSVEFLIMEKWTSSTQVATLGQSMFIVGTAVGPAFLGPLSDIGGRKWVYVVSIFLYAVLNIGTALAYNFPMLVIFCFLTGVAGSVALSNVAGTISDLYRHHGIDANAIIDAAESLTAGAPVRHRKMAV